MKKDKEIKRARRHKRLRKKIIGSQERPRLVVHRSLKNLCAQFIDDITGKTMCSVSTLDPKLKEKIKYGGNIKAAQILGETAASIAKSKGITKVVFDACGYVYHGRVKAFADSARKGGLIF
ncbi:MAG: 50S ribosomal protein L18 [Candidatus Omnitrophica bacterium]|nr:50S ribosomal protein L18 [Candidatus Omnitrophota bacterium]